MGVSMEGPSSEGDIIDASAANARAGDRSSLAGSGVVDKINSGVRDEGRSKSGVPVGVGVARLSPFGLSALALLPPGCHTGAETLSPLRGFGAWSPFRSGSGVCSPLPALPPPFSPYLPYPPARLGLSFRFSPPPEAEAAPLVLGRWA